MSISLTYSPLCYMNTSRALLGRDKMTDNTPQRKEIDRIPIDKINDKDQKEKTLAKVGLTRERIYRKIVDKLEAKKMGDIVDDQGNVRRGLIIDKESQEWAVEQAIKIFQDDKASLINIEGNTVNNNTLNIDVSKLDTTQLIDVLMGRHKPIEIRPSKPADLS